MSPREIALDHHAGRQRLVTAAADLADRAWTAVNPARIVESWTSLVAELTVQVSGAQMAAAGQADPYLDAVAMAEDVGAATTGATVEARALAGVASDGRGLGSLLLQPPFTALQGIGAGMPVGQALALAGQHLDTMVRTQVADAGRVADGVALTARPAFGGYTRMLSPPSCARCVILAGKHYQWSAGFQRHPRCDCVHIPAAENTGGALETSPRRYFDSLPASEQNRVFGQAGARAIRDGADVGQVVNARRGIYTAGDRKLTVESTTRRGVAAGRVRLTPEQIYKEAAGNRAEAVRLLQRHGYLTPGTVAKTVRRDEVRLAAKRPGPATVHRAGVADKVHIRPALEQARTTRQIAEAFQTEAKRLTGRSVRASFSQASTVTAREHAEGILRGLERFPKARLFFVDSSAGIGDLSETYAYAGGGRIHFNTLWSSAAGRRRYLETLQKGVAGWDRQIFQFGRYVSDYGWSPRGTGNPMAVAIHEFGHILDVDTLAGRIKADVAEAIRRRAAAEGVTARTLITQQLGGYALTSEHELVAEAFADVMMNGDAASDLSHEIFDLLEAEYRRRN